MKNKFAFIGHPVDLKSFYDFLGIWGGIARILPESFVESITLKAPPIKLVSLKKIRSKDNAEISGEAIVCPLLPKQMAFLGEEIVLRKIIQAAKLGERLGAKIIGLGGFASVIGNEGEAVSREINIAVTSGNTYTAALALEGIFKAAELMGIALNNATVAIIGATGDIGSICTKILAKKVKKVNLAARNEKKLNEFAELVRELSEAEVGIFKYVRDAVKDADIILTATSAISTVIEPEFIKSGAVVCDVAIPANIAKEIAYKRDDILVFEGGLAKLPFPEDVEYKRLRSVLPPGHIYGCLAETIVLTFAGKFENYSIGRGNITEEKINEISKLAREYGLKLSDFFCGFKFFTDKNIRQIKENALQGRVKVNAAKG